MPPRILVPVFALLAPLAASAGALTSLHPEEAYPDDAEVLASPGAFAGLISEAQAKLHQRGFNAGPVNGDFGAKTQAALAQFQRASDLPVSGMLDDATRAELGIGERSGGE